MRKPLVLTVDELEALKRAVDGIPWMPMTLAGYRAVQSVAEKLDQALTEAEAERARQRGDEDGAAG